MNSIDNPTHSPTHLESMGDSKQPFPSQRKALQQIQAEVQLGLIQPQILGFLAAFTAAMGMYSLLYSWELDSHCCFCKQRENAMNLICGH